MAARAVSTSTLAAAATMVLAAAVLLAGGASAQSPPSSPASQCTSVLVSLSPCLNYISGNESTAPASCCAQLGKVVRSDPQCLCVALAADPAALGLSVNRTRALGLPAACNLTTPDVSSCKGAGAAARRGVQDNAGDGVRARRRRRVAAGIARCQAGRGLRRRGRPRRRRRVIARRSRDGFEVARLAGVAFLSIFFLWFVDP